MQGFIKIIIYVGLGLLLLGLFLAVINRFIPLGKLPGDFVWKRGNVAVFFPLATMLLLSLILSLVLNFLFRR